MPEGCPSSSEHRDIGIDRQTIKEVYAHIPVHMGLKLDLILGLGIRGNEFGIVFIFRSGFQIGPLYLV